MSVIVIVHGITVRVRMVPAGQERPDHIPLHLA